MILYKIFNIKELLKNNHDFANIKNLKSNEINVENFKS